VQDFTATSLDLGLVPIGRLGAALHARRGDAGTTVAALSRSSEGRFLPDALIALERGNAHVGDADIEDVVALYELAPRALPMGPAVELVFDRSTGLDVAGGSAAIFAGAGSEPGPIDVDAVLARFVALSVLMCLDLTCGDVGLGRLAAAMHLEIGELSTRLESLLDEQAEEIVTLVGRLSDRIAVPCAGLLVAQLAGGSLLLVKRHGVTVRGPAVPACGRFSDLLDVVA
jgi:hypothetical protein